MVEKPVLDSFLIAALPNGSYRVSWPNLSLGDLRNSQIVEFAFQTGSEYAKFTCSDGLTLTLGACSYFDRHFRLGVILSRLSAVIAVDLDTYDHATEFVILMEKQIHWNALNKRHDNTN